MVISYTCITKSYQLSIRAVCMKIAEFTTCTLEIGFCGQLRCSMESNHVLFHIINISHMQTEISFLTIM